MVAVVMMVYKAVLKLVTKTSDCGPFEILTDTINFPTNFKVPNYWIAYSFVIRYEPLRRLYPSPQRSQQVIVPNVSSILSSECFNGNSGNADS